jgi:hypothetical protein
MPGTGPHSGVTGIPFGQARGSKAGSEVCSSVASPAWKADAGIEVVVVVGTDEDVDDVEADDAGESTAKLVPVTKTKKDKKK